MNMYTSVLITVSDWMQSKIQPHEYVYYKIML